MTEVALAALPYALLWELGVVWVAVSTALGLRDGRRWAWYAAGALAVVSPGLAIVAAHEVGPAATVPFLLGPVVLALLIPEPSARWLRHRRMVRTPLYTAPVESDRRPVPAGRPSRPSSAVLAVQSDYTLVGVVRSGRMSG